MWCKSIFNYRFVLGLSNLALSACGFILLAYGFALYTDTNRILLSRLIGASSDQLSHLSHPFFYYIALALAVAGLIAIFASFIGWWATCLNNYYILSIYFLVVLLLLLIEFSVCLMITFWPQCLGLNLDASVMVKVLQAGYGVPGKEQLTAAIDLAQTKFKCCAINSDINYDTSLWRLQGYGQRDWAVPLTCCFLRNRHEPQSYLDPKPENLTMCQSLQKHEHNLARHSDGCLDALDEWYRAHYITFLAGSAIVAIVEFAVLLSIILSCTRTSRRRVALTTTGTSMAMNVVHSRPAKKRRVPIPQQTVFSTANDNVYMNSVTSEHSGGGGGGGALHLHGTNAQKNFNDTETTIHPYHISKSYLV